MQDAALRKALDLWERVSAFENWACKARRGGEPPAGTSPHFAALAVVYPPVCPALAFVPARLLSRGHPDFRPLWPGEEQALQAAARASELGLRPGAAQQ